MSTNKVVYRIDKGGYPTGDMERIHETKEGAEEYLRSLGLTQVTFKSKSEGFVKDSTSNYWRNISLDYTNYKANDEARTLTEIPMFQ